MANRLPVFIFYSVLSRASLVLFDWHLETMSDILRHNRQASEGKFVAETIFLALSPTTTTPPQGSFSGIHPSFQENTSTVWFFRGVIGNSIGASLMILTIRIAREMSEATSPRPLPPAATTGNFPRSLICVLPPSGTVRRLYLLRCMLLFHSSLMPHHWFFLATGDWQRHEIFVKFVS
jgi:hypothetical protein